MRSATSDSTELLNPRGPVREPRNLRRDLRAGGQERRQASVNAEVREARLPENPIPPIEDRLDHPEMLVHVFPELVTTHLEDLPRPTGPRLHLLEHPTFAVVVEDRRDLRDDVPPHALLEDLVAPVFQRGREAFLSPWIEGRLGPFAFEEIRNVVPH